MTALILDCDGVLADTERFGHLAAFNATFEQFGLPVRWSETEYGRRLRIGGGKERLRSLFDDPTIIDEAELPADPEARQDLVQRWHRRKTQLFTDIVARGDLPARPGVRRVIQDALAAGWTVAIASTSAEPSVRAVLEQAVGTDSASQIPIFAGDVVAKKKPDPSIYQLVVSALRLDPRDAIVIEDSRNGLLAAHGAGLRCVVTVSSYTRGEDFTEAELVVSELGDPGQAPIEVLRGALQGSSYLTLEDLKRCLDVPSAVEAMTQ